MDIHHKNASQTASKLGFQNIFEREGLAKNYLKAFYGK